MEKKLWNQQWYFWEDQNPFELVWSLPNHAVKVDLPHDAMIVKKPRPDSPNGYNTGFRDGGMFTYVKYLYVPEASEKETVLLKFEGVYMNAFVYVNGELAGKRPYGFSAFYVELTPFLRAGEDNEIRVQVRAGAAKNNRWYSGAGIYRNVYLITGKQADIVPDSLQVTTENADARLAVLQVGLELENRTSETVSTMTGISILDEAGNQVGAERIRAELLPGKKRKLNCRIAVKNPALWSAETPTLLRCSAVMETSKFDSVSREETLFGIRTMTLDAVRGLTVNGETVKLRGGCIHHDSGLLGAAEYEDAKLRQIYRLKDAGFNAVRMAHNPCSQAILDACDRLGMYVMDEAFDMWYRSKNDYDYGLYFSEWWERDLEEMVRKDYNHPSVIMYSLGNEIPEIGMLKGSDICDQMARKLKHLDPTRYTLAAINGISASSYYLGEIQKDVVAELDRQGVIVGDVNDFMTLMNSYQDQIVTHPAVSRILETACAPTDIAGYNYMTGRYEMDGRDYPNRVIVGSETYPPEIARNWDCVKRMNHVIGDFTWAGWDYIGEAGVGIPGYAFGEGGFMAQFPAQLPYVGDFDLTGRRRPASFYREIVFGRRTDPYIVVVNPRKDEEKLEKTPWIISDATPCWTWAGCEGQELTVEIYAAGDEAELLQDGISIGRKPVGQNRIVRFPVRYSAGTLEAVSYENQQVIGKSILRSAGIRDRLTAAVEQDVEMKQLTYIDIQLQDASGITVTEDSQEISVEISGPAVLKGFGSGDPRPSHNYNECVTNLFMGCAHLIVEKGKDPSEITIHCGNLKTTVSV